MGSNPKVREMVEAREQTVGVETFDLTLNEFVETGLSSVPPGYASYRRYTSQTGGETFQFVRICSSIATHDLVRDTNAQVLRSFHMRNLPPHADVLRTAEKRIIQWVKDTFYCQCDDCIADRVLGKLG